MERHGFFTGNLFKKEINSLLEFQKVCARWVPQKLTDEMKAERIKSFKGNSEEDGEGFLRQIVRGNKTWSHCHDPENERQSMEYHYKVSQAPKKFRTKASAAKVVLAVF
jgi:hypothetical protein